MLSSHDTASHRHNTIEIVEENPGQFTWRIVLRDNDTQQVIGAPIDSVSIYASRDAADQAAKEALRELEAGSFMFQSPRAQG